MVLPASKMRKDGLIEELIDESVVAIKWEEINAVYMGLELDSQGDSKGKNKEGEVQLDGKYPIT